MSRYRYFIDGNGQWRANDIRVEYRADSARPWRASSLFADIADFLGEEEAELSKGELKEVTPG